jgi:hypothetical protein
VNGGWVAEWGEIIWVLYNFVIAVAPLEKRSGCTNGEHDVDRVPGGAIETRLYFSTAVLKYYSFYLLFTVFFA